MSQTNGFPNTNGCDEKNPAELEESGALQAGDHIKMPPAELHVKYDYMKDITIPLNDVPAFTPRKKLRIVTIGAGYAGMILAEKLQYKYAKEMDEILEHTIFEAKDCVGGTWVANTYPGVMCDVPSAIYVRQLGNLDMRFRD